MESWKSCLLFTFFAICGILLQFPWIAFTSLKIVAVFAILLVVIWCMYQTVQIVQTFNTKAPVSTTLGEEQMQYRESTYGDIPSGWYPLCWSHEVKSGQVIQVNALGKAFAIFRGDINGEIGVLDAYCPHLGASLVTAGKVCNDLLQCAFHQWKFDKNGVCRDIPYLNGKKIPKNANVSCYNCSEYHDMICVYFDKENMKSTTCVPSYNLPLQHNLVDTSKYAYIGSLDHGVVRMHIQEFAENAADWMHFGPIHGKMMFPFTQMQIPLIDRWLTIHHSPSTHIGGGAGGNKDKVAIDENNYGPNDKHFLYFINRSHLLWNGESIPNTHGNAQITFCGPAGICIFKFVIPAYDANEEIVLFHTHLPLDKMKLRVRFHWYASKKLPRWLVWYVVGNWISQWTNDIDIWENKIFLKKPCLVKGDGPLFKVRRWWRQFYPDPDKEEKKVEKVRIDTEEHHSDKCVASEHIQHQENKNVDW